MSSRHRIDQLQRGCWLAGKDEEGDRLLSEECRTRTTSKKLVMCLGVGTWPSSSGGSLVSNTTNSKTWTPDTNLTPRMIFPSTLIGTAISHPVSRSRSRY